MPDSTPDDPRGKFKRNLLADRDRWLLSEMENVKSNADSRETPLPEAPLEKRPKVHDDVFAAFLRSDQGAASASERDRSAESHAHELNKYKMFKVSVVSYDRQDPLQFWKAVAADFPVLSLLAKQVFCVCATSAQSERDFSAVGLTITQLRASLSPIKVEAVQLLRSAQLAGMLTTEFAVIQ